MTTVHPPGASRAPTIDDIRLGMRRALDAGYDETWAAVCASAQVSPEATALDDAGLEALLNSLATTSPLCRVLAMSWRIRRTAAIKLNQLHR